MIRKILGLVAVLVILRVVLSLLDQFGIAGGVGVALAWLAFVWVLVRAWPACRADVARVGAFVSTRLVRVHRDAGGGF